MKKLVTSIVVGSLLFGGVAYANEGYEVVSADTEIHETVESTEEAEVVLTEELDEEAVLEDEDVLTEELDQEVVLEDDIAKILEEIEDALENSTGETKEKLIEDLNKLIEDLNKNLEEIDENLDEEKESDDIIVIDSQDKEKSSRRGENLLRLLEREDLPATAKAGITKALANQERAKAKKLEESVQVSEQSVDVVEEQDEIIVLDDQDQDEAETENTSKQEKRNRKGKQKNARSVVVRLNQRK